VHPRRFFPAVIIGGGAAGFLMALPILGDVLRCALCIGVLAGSGLSMKLWLDTHLAENLSPTEAAYLGAVSGGVSAAVSWVVAVPIRLAFGDDIGDFYLARELVPDTVKYLLRAMYTSDFGSLVMSLLFQVVVYGAMGALGGFLAIQYLFPARRTAAEGPPG
jgi:hypothetical protein